MDCMTVEPRLDDVRDRRVRYDDASPTECGDGGTARRPLRDGRHLDRNAEHVGEHLQPGRVCEQAAAGRHDGLEAADRVEHVGEPVADGLERGLRDVDRRRRERQAVDRAAARRIPAERALAAEERLEDEAVRNRRGAIHGLSFATTPLDIAQAALEAVCYRLAAVLAAIGGIDSVVATGGGLLSSPDWVQVLADVLGRPVEVSGVGEGSSRGAAMIALEQFGVPIPPAPVARVVEPRLDRHEIHLNAMHVRGVE